MLVFHVGPVVIIKKDASLHATNSKPNPNPYLTTLYFTASLLHNITLP